MAQLNVKAGVRRYQNRAADLGSWTPPVLRSRTKDGDIVHERIPSAGHVLMVNPAGHVVRVQLYCGMGKPEKNNHYFLQISREKMEQGFVPFGQCPKLHGLGNSLPERVRDGSICKLDASGEHPIDDQHPCSCVVAVIEHRQTRNDKAMADIDERYQSKEARQMDKLASAVEAISEVANNQSGGRRRRKSEDGE